MISSTQQEAISNGSCLVVMTLAFQSSDSISHFVLLEVTV